MKKKMFGAGLAALFSVAMIMSASAGELTAEQVLLNYQEASAQATNFTAALTAGADITLSIPEADMSMGITGDMTMDMKAATNPLQVEMSADMNGSMMGQGGKMSMQMYMVPADDGSFEYYMGSDADDGNGMQWVLSTIDADTAGQLTEMIGNSGSGTLANMPINYELIDGTVDINGTPCYALTASLNWDDMMNLYTYAMQAVSTAAGQELPTDALPDEDTLAAMGSMLGGLELYVEMDVDAEDFRVVRMLADLNDSDWAALGTTVAAMMGLTDDEGNLMNVSLQGNDVSLECFYSYDTPVSVTVPQEVKDAAANVGNAMDLAGSVDLNSAAAAVGELESGQSAQ